ncbi:MAG: hypothetical protein K2G39_09095, partial [Lachnospiraceae bacterium]|nr:hypothetical protein [Lachnospiraceae bacterium]
IVCAAAYGLYGYACGALSLLPWGTCPQNHLNQANGKIWTDIIFFSIMWKRMRSAERQVRERCGC